MLKLSSKNWINAGSTLSHFHGCPWKPVNKFKLWRFIKLIFIDKMCQTFVPLFGPILELSYCEIGCDVWLLVAHELNPKVSKKNPFFKTWNWNLHWTHVYLSKSQNPLIGWCWSFKQSWRSQVDEQFFLREIIKFIREIRRT